MASATSAGPSRDPLRAVEESLELPPGDAFVALRGRRGLMVCRASLQGALEQAGFGPDGRRGEERLPDAAEAGREPLGRLQLGDVAALVRRFTHGGLLRAVTGTRFRDPGRPFEELRLSERLRDLGIPTPRVLAARAVRARGFGYELALVTERLEGTRDIGHLIGDVRRGEAPVGALRRAVRDAGALVGRLHDVGFLHADLQPANLLVHRAPRTRGAIALDLDGSAFHEAPLAADLRLGNLARLWRHVKRREREHGAVLSPADLALFLVGYGTPAREIPDLMTRIDGRSERGGLAHRVGWWAERLLGRGVDQRAAGTRG